MELEIKKEDDNNDITEYVSDENPSIGTCVIFWCIHFSKYPPVNAGHFTSVLLVQITSDEVTAVYDCVWQVITRKVCKI